MVDDREVHDYRKHQRHRTVLSHRALQARADSCPATPVDLVVSEISPYEAKVRDGP
jgi:hypothetical protein